MLQNLLDLWNSTGLYHLTWGQCAMLGVGFLLLYLAIRKDFEPLLLVPIGFGGILANIPYAGLADPAWFHALTYGAPELVAQIQTLLGGVEYHAADPMVQQAVNHLARSAGHQDGILYLFYAIGLQSGVFPLLIFMGVGAMTDFGPLLANPRTLLLGAAAQVGIFITLIGALLLGFEIPEAASIGIIGGADGPTAIYVTSTLAPHLLGAIAVAAYSYMALVPLIQPPIMRLLTTESERKIEMTQLRPVSTLEKIVFPLVLLVLVALILPDAAPLLGMFCFGNLMRECGVVERLNNTTQNALINIVTIFLGLSVGSKLQAEQFLNLQTLMILLLGVVAFSVGTGSGVLMAKLMNFFSRRAINPLIGAAGVSAVPMAARVANKVGQESNPHNYLLMHAMGPNVAGVIGSAIAAGVLISYCKGL
jgi:sodium ion-translocating decarboxylase beta subunit